MRILAGHIPTPDALAALGCAIDHAAATGGSLTVLTTGQSGGLADGISYDIRRPTDATPAAEAMITLADEPPAGPMVIGLRRRSPVGRLISGRTAPAILPSADCPVVGVKPRRH